MTLDNDNDNAPMSSQPSGLFWVPFVALFSRFVPQHLLGIFERTDLMFSPLSLPTSGWLI